MRKVRFLKIQDFAENYVRDHCGNSKELARKLALDTITKLLKDGLLDIYCKDDYLGYENVLWLLEDIASEDKELNVAAAVQLLEVFGSWTKHFSIGLPLDPSLVNNISDFLEIVACQATCLAFIPADDIKRCYEGLLDINVSTLGKFADLGIVPTNPVDAAIGLAAMSAATGYPSRI